MKQTLLDGLVESKKIQLGLLAVLASLFGDSLGLTPEQISNATNSLIGLIVGIGVVDAGKAVASAKPPAGG